MVSCGDHDLPKDLLIQILSRLPVKSRVCYKWVCPYWNALIESPMFITTHFNHPKNHTRLLVHYCKEHRSYRYESTFNLYLDDETIVNDENELLVHEDIDNPLVKTTYPLPKKPFSHFRDMFGPVNGLFLVHYASNPETYNVALWNPATKEFRNFPAPAFNFPPSNYTYNGLNFGFGLDPFTDDYKVVLILFYVDEKNLSGIFNTYNDKITTRGRNCIYLDGAYYWMSRDQGDNSLTRIVMFDMAKEVFRDIEPPPCRFLDNVDIWKGMILESIEVWIMEGEGNGDILLGTCSFELLLYSPNKHQVRDFGTKGRKLKVFNYKETVAPIMPRSRKLQEVNPITGFLPFPLSQYPIPYCPRPCSTQFIEYFSTKTWDVCKHCVVLYRFGPLKEIIQALSGSGCKSHLLNFACEAAKNG
ncbi:hypothetical protein LguiB_008943 [Lonicera macranthoides]